MRAGTTNFRVNLRNSSAVVHGTDTGQPLPIKPRPYRVSPLERHTIEDQVFDMVAGGVVHKSGSWSSHVVLLRENFADMHGALPATRTNLRISARIDDARDALCTELQSVF